MAPLEIKPHAKLDKPLRFELVLAEISTLFINLPADRIDSEIEAAQRRVCELLDLDRSTLFQVPEGEPGTMLLTHIYQPPGSVSPPNPMNIKDTFPWALQKTLAGETITISKMTDLPAEASCDRESFHLYGTRSVVAVPLWVGGWGVFGLLTFAVIREERGWPETVVQQFKLLAQVFANALARKRAYLELRENEARLNLATDAAGAGLWIMEVNTGNVWITPKTRELFYFAPDEDLNYESFFKMMHHDDHEPFRRAVQQTLLSGEDLKGDFRILLPNGSIRWILIRGKRHHKSTGEPDRLMGVSLDISERKRMEDELIERLKEIEKLKLQLENENLYLRKELKREKGFDKIVGDSKAIRFVIFSAGQVAPTDATVLILGETGTGKGMVANAIHQMSARKDRPIVTVNCTALPQNLIESEIFGREKGAFTGAHARQAGRFEVADGGTIFLDEIGEMPLELQSKLLRVLQEGEFERLGSARTVKVNVRVIAATSRDLKKEVRERCFREDLFYRLNVFPISIPPLRQRTEDIPLLAQYFIEKYARKMGKHIESIPKSTIKTFMDYDWPGNVRELEHVIERGVIMTSGRSFRLACKLISSLPVDSKDEPLKDLTTLEREHILRVLQEAGWRIEGPSGAASILKLNPSTLRFRIKKLGIRRPA